MTITITVSDVRSLMRYGKEDIRGELIRLGTAGVVYEIVDYNIDDRTVELREYKPAEKSSFAERVGS